MIYPIKHLPRDIPVGIQTETGVEAIGFDMKPWMDEFDGLKFSVWATRPGENAAYPAADVELVGTVLYWKPNGVDTEIAGNGKVEILAITGDKRKLSGWCETNVKATSLAVTQEVPEAARPWVDEVLEAADEAKRQADRAEKIANGMSGGVISGVVRYDEEQNLTEEEKAQARKNIGADVGVNFTTNETLNLSEDGVLSVNTADDVEDNSYLPVTSAAVKAALDKIPNTGSVNVYVGADEPPEGAEVWIDPEAAISPDEIPGVKVEETEEGVVVTATSWDGVTQALVRHGKDSEGSTVQVDKTLTIENAAADAKVVGDKFIALSEEIAKLPTGGGGAAIIDVTELPTDGINEDVFYRLLTGAFYANATPQGDWTCRVVKTLPIEGEPVTTDMVHVLLYYAVDTGSVSGYIPSALSGAVGVPAGWYPVEALAQAFNLAWGGIIWDESEDPNDGANRLVLKYAVFYFKQEWINLSDKVGWRSPEGNGAEVFNSLNNTASGNNSHAEGGNTTASGNRSHAEGYNTTASGNSSHAEGYNTTASGTSSHAEGTETRALGDDSHAEGYNTTASGDRSHAEGYNTTAQGEQQHVQGKYNIVDTNNKYAHIVGNGEYDGFRSNAHTLDWDGNAWFAGGIELTSPNGTRYRFNVSDDGTLTATVVTE